MRTERVSMRSVIACIVGIIIGGVGCSDGSTDGENEATGGTGVSGGGPATGGTGGQEPVVTGGAFGEGARPATGGVTGDGGTPPATGGAETGGVLATGGTLVTTGGADTGGAATGGAATGGADTGGAEAGGAATGGVGADTGGITGTGGVFTGTCTASEGTDRSVSGSGPHEVIVETNSDDGINEGTIYRPADMGGAEKYPIFVWGNGACSRQGYSNATAMGEIASHGYFVVADGTPSGDGETIGMSNDVEGMARPLLAYITWAIAENDKPCSAYYQSLDTTKIAANGFSCGGLMAAGTASDPRMTTYGITGGGLTGSDHGSVAPFPDPRPTPPATTASRVPSPLAIPVGSLRGRAPGRNHPAPG